VEEQFIQSTLGAGGRGGEPVEANHAGQVSKECCNTGMVVVEVGGGATLPARGGEKKVGVSLVDKGGSWDSQQFGGEEEKET